MTPTPISEATIKSQGAKQNSYFMLLFFEVKQFSNRIILVKILVGQQVFGFLSVYVPQRCLMGAVRIYSMTNYVPSQHQHPSSHMMIVMTVDAVQAQITKRYMAAEV